MPRRNNNALRVRTRPRSATKQMAIRRSNGDIVMVTPVTRVNADGHITVDMDGLLVEVQARQLIHV